MKKVLSLIMALVLCLGLCACGGSEKDTSENKMTKEDMLACAESFDSVTFTNDCNSNIVTAKEKYIGKIYRRAALVSKITDEGCYTGSWFIPLEKETIAKLAVGKSIDIVFKVDDIIHEEIEENNGYGTTKTHSNKIVADQIYYVGETSKIKAKVIDVATNAMFVYLLDEFGKTPCTCRLSVKLTQEEVDTYTYGDIVYVEGTVCKVDTYYFESLVETIPISYEIENAVLTAQ